MQFKRLKLPAATEAVLSAEAATAESMGRLTDVQLEIIRDAGWFRMFVPLSSGGTQVPLPEALRIEETLAAIDGSLGWTVTLCSGAGLFAGFVDPALLAQMFSDPELCIGGSGMPTGTAERIKDGYRVSGSWQFATGAPHLTAFSTNCRITENGLPVRDAAGEDVVRSFLFLPAEVTVQADWQVMGLRATASHSFTITDLIVPSNRSFRILPQCATSGDPVYQYPFMQFAELTLAANFGGLALGFLECFEANLTRHRGNESRQKLRNEALQIAQSRLDPVLVHFHGTAARSWEELCNSGTISAPTLAEISEVSRQLAIDARELVTALMPYAGLAAANPEHRLNRIWRDLFTATQHSLLNYPI